MLNGNIGARISRDVPGSERTAYGQRIVADLGTALPREFEHRYSWRNLFNMVTFVVTYPHLSILQTVSAKSSQPHHNKTGACRAKQESDLKRAENVRRVPTSK